MDSILSFIDKSKKWALNTSFTVIATISVLRRTYAEK